LVKYLKDEVIWSSWNSALIKKLCLQVSHSKFKEILGYTKFI
jgi:hypothetical protein